MIRLETSKTGVDAYPSFWQVSCGGETSLADICTWLADRREAIAQLISIAREGDVVVLAGRGREDYQVIGDRSVLFNDCEVARELITNLFNGQGAQN